ncbi:MAG: terminase [Tissierellia bacterium]|nr:terminase [Tissierellia bacterium]
MSNENKGMRRIAGAWGTLHWDGEAVFEVEECSADIEVERGDVMVGIDVDSKMTGLKGSGSFKVQHVYTRGVKKLLDAYKKGHDPRSVLSLALNDPDAVGGQRERVNLGNVWFNKFQVAGFTKPEIVGREFEFGFTPTDSDIAEGIY